MIRIIKDRVIFSRDSSNYSDLLSFQPLEKGGRKIIGSKIIFPDNGKNSFGFPTLGTHPRRSVSIRVHPWLNVSSPGAADTECRSWSAGRVKWKPVLSAFGEITPRTYELWEPEQAPNNGRSKWVSTKSSGRPNSYDKDWEQRSYPIGNGYVGACVFGRTDTERIRFTSAVGESYVVDLKT